ncbi:hypothetical protein [Thermus tengchongensis]|uniref:Uncharacterized protein n=1 Tax=Thermus tengchongensis TaxID=1214928 RepID=A0A4Y9F9Y4_9DEIN|nr:hypothetical protein [Thermus tengchongensis]TFU24978.1 hypothetical protein E0687_13100 [Thermus tengchongensis]
MVRAKDIHIQAKSLRKERCPLCQGEGILLAFRPLGEPPRPPLLGYWDPAEVWEACPECEGAGHLPAEPEENPDPWGLLLKIRATPVTWGRGGEEVEELADWVAAYRRLRQGAKLPPEEAARAASVEVFGPLPF